MPSTFRPARSFVAFRHADQRDLGAFYWCATLGASGAPRNLGLSFRAERYLTAFGVLVKAGEHGFRGVRAPLWAVSAFVGEVTRAPSSKDTTRRALAELEREGWITVGRYGGGKPRELLNAAGDPYWVRDQVLVVTFEAKLWELFERRPARARLEVVSAPTLDHGSQVAGVSIPDIEPAFRQASQRAPGRDRSGPLDLEQGKAEPGPGPGPGALDCGGPAPSAGPPSVDRSSCRKAQRGRGSKLRAMPPELRGSRPFVRREAARALLEVLARVAEKHGRPGRAAVARAALELADPVAAAASLVAWDYWLTRWGDMTSAERRRVLRSEVLPAMLRQGGAVVVGLPPPAEPGPPLPSPAAGAPAGAGGAPADLDAAMVEAARSGSSFARRWLEDRGRSW